MVKAVLFDMDGVLIDNSDMHAKAFAVMYERFNVEVSRRKNLMDFMGCGLREILINMLPRELIKEKGLDFLCEEKERIYREIYRETIKPVKGLVDLLKRLKSYKIKCAVGSSGCIENVDFVLERCHIIEYFDAIVSGDSVTRCKPDPEIYLLAADKLRVMPSDCLVFEDAPIGIMSAKRAGVHHVIALLTSFACSDLEKCSPEYIVRDFQEVSDEML